MRSAECVLSNIDLGVNTKKCLYEGLIVPMALHGAEALGMSVVYVMHSH